MSEGRLNSDPNEMYADDFSGNEALDARILLALETAPSVTIAAGFTARVMAQLPARPTIAVTPARYGYRMGAACLLFVIALMAAFAHQGMARSWFGIALEWTLFLEIVVIAVWLVVRSAGYTLTSIF